MHFTIDKEIKLHWNTITEHILKWVQLRGKTRYKGKETKNVLRMIHYDITTYWKKMFDANYHSELIKLKNKGQNYVL